MSTHAHIAIRRPSGQVRSIYCHSDGMLKGVGETLHEHYQDPEKTLALLSGGDISSLGASIECPAGHSFDFDKRVADYTVFYHRDRGDRKEVASVHESISDWLLDVPRFFYGYLFTDGQWFYVDPQDDPDVLIPLADILELERACS